MKIFRLVALPLALLCAPAYAQDEARPVAHVNGVRIEQAALDQAVEQAIRQGARDSEHLRRMVRDQLIARELFVQEARKRDLDNDSQVLAIVEEARRNAMIQRYLREAIVPRDFADQEVREQYERVKASLGAQEYKLRVVQVATEDRARAIREQVLAGKPLAELAREESLSPSAQTDGELEWLTFRTPAQEGQTGRLPLPIAQAAEKLAKGAISEPIEVKDMWWLVRVEDVRATRVPAFDEVKAQIVEMLRTRVLERATAQLVQQLLKSATITQ